ncbi:MAG: dephospho-CoA kinase [Leeuwenhoekiella sp.]
MIVVGLTGGIGSGKSTIAGFFKQFGVSVYIADEEAKKLMHTPELVDKITALFGNEAYVDNILNRGFIADLVFNNKDLLAQLNAIVHPAVKRHFDLWATQQESSYVVKEAAILFENEGYKQCDCTILVTAPEEIRIARVIERDKSTRENVKARMKQQWDDKRKVALADFIIDNIELENSLEEARKIHVKIVRTLVNR